MGARRGDRQLEERALPRLDPGDLCAGFAGRVWPRSATVSRLCACARRTAEKVKMAAAGAAVLGARWLRRATRGVVPLGARTAFHMTKDMLPGPYPRTPEERAAAAKKYNLRVEDYEPYPDDGTGHGDYPKLPDRSQQERDPWYEWDHSDLRLNWGETGPKQYPYNNLYLERGGDPTKEPEQVVHYEI
ncbi:hypothetical protein NN561_007241 [Cricetulus griseus]